jgi:DNA-binding transcriptional ArsR family regulator
MHEAAHLKVIRGPEKAATLLQRTRRLLLSHLAEPDSAAGLSRRLKLPRQRINYHLRQLKREGLLECVEERRKGNCVERLVRATARSFVISPEALGTLGDAPEAARDRYSSAFLMTAAARAIREVAATEAKARGGGKRLATLTLEAEIRFASAGARAAFAEELSDAVARLAAKHHDAKAEGGLMFRLLAAVYPANTNPAGGGPGGPEAPGPAGPNKGRQDDDG